MKCSIWCGGEQDMEHVSSVLKELSAGGGSGGSGSGDGLNLSQELDPPALTNLPNDGEDCKTLQL